MMQKTFVNSWHTLLLIFFDFGLSAANARGFPERSCGTHANQWGVLTMDDDDSIVFGSQDVM